MFIEVGEYHPLNTIFHIINIETISDYDQDHSIIYFTNGRRWYVTDNYKKFLSHMLLTGKDIDADIEKGVEIGS